MDDSYTLVTTRDIDAPLENGLAPFQSVVDMEAVGNRTRVVLKARFSSEEDRRRHVEEFHAVEGTRQLLQRLEEQARMDT